MLGVLGVNLSGFGRRLQTERQLGGKMSFDDAHFMRFI